MRTLARTLQRKRKVELGVTGNLSESWEEMLVPEVFTKTVDGEEFIILDEPLEGKVGKVWGFCSPTGLAILKGAKDVYGDGTFEIVKSTLFYQLWVLVARSESNKVTVPCCYFLLPDKSFATYTLLLSRLKELGVTGPDVFHLDFESAAIKAVKAVFPSTAVECCDTHWKRTLRRQQQEIGLLKYSNQCVDIQQFLRLLWALCYVPKEEVLSVYLDHVLPKMPEVDEEVDENQEEAAEYGEALEKFMDYFELTWVGKVNKRTNLRGKPKFALDLWNKFDAAESGRDDLTNNNSEAQNSVQKMLLPMSPNIWAVLRSIKDEESLAHAKFTAALSGEPVDSNPGRTKARLLKARTLTKIVRQYKELPIKTYLEAISSHFNS